MEHKWDEIREMLVIELQKNHSSIFFSVNNSTLDLSIRRITRKANKKKDVEFWIISKLLQ